MTQKAAAGDWWLHHDNTPTHASCLVLSFLTKRQITQVTQPHYSPDLAPCDFWLFPKLKSPLKGRRFHTINEIQEWDKAADDDWNCVGSQGAYFEGTEMSLSYVQRFLYFVSSSINVSVSHST